MGLAAPFDTLDTLAPEALARWWTRRVRRVLRVAAEELPFYRERFRRAGLDPSAVRRLEDLRRVPRFEKRDLLDAQRRSGSARLGIERGTDAPGTVFAASSGTAGTTFVALPPRWRREQGRSSLRAHWWAGLRPGSPFLVTAPAWHSYATVQTAFAARLGMPCAIVAGTYLPRFARRIVDALVTLRPRFLTLFLPMVFSLRAEARARGLSEREPFASLESLVVTGAPITPGMREALARATGVPRVVELAGSSENLLAVECPEQRGLHVVPDTCYAEVLDPASGETVAPGVRGRVVHTALVPWGSVYVRFDGGDVGTWDSSPCPCGLPSPRIRLLGRAEESFRLGGRDWLPYDVQLAVEAEVPELAGTPSAILREPLAAGRLALVLPRPEGIDRARARAMDALPDRLGRRLEVPVEVRLASTLPLRFKGVPSLVAEREVG